jgi:hypothetical protein
MQRGKNKTTMKQFVKCMAAVHLAASGIALLMGLGKLLEYAGSAVPEYHTAELLTGAILMSSALFTALVAGAIYAVMDALPERAEKHPTPARLPIPPAQPISPVGEPVVPPAAEPVQYTITGQPVKSN